MSKPDDKVAAIILAAGLSRRMGTQNKLLKTWQGKPLLSHVCEAALASNCDRVIVVTGYQQQAVKALLGERNISFIHNDDFEQGMASSVRIAIKTVTSLNFDKALIMLADMPLINSDMLNLLIDASMRNYEKVIVATSQGKRRNPVLWPQTYFDKLMLLEGDKGARELMTDEDQNIVEVELGMPADFDLDTKEAFNC